MILAEKIMMLRKKSAWSQEELAEQLGISRQSVSKWESGASIPDLDKILKMSALFGVGTDYLLKDELEEVSFSETDTFYEEEVGRVVTLEEANQFMELSRVCAKRFAAAVSLFILSPVCMMFLVGMSELPNSTITEDMAGGIGSIIVLLFVAIGVAIIILNGMKLDKYEYMGKEKLSLQYGIAGIAERKRDEFAPTLRSCIAAGVVLCITAAIPILIGACVGASDIIVIGCVNLLLVLIAFAVFLFVWPSSINESYQMLLEEGDYTVEKKTLNKKTSYFPGIYWCTVAALFLGIGFYQGDWKAAGVIWPIAGVLFVAVYGIVKVITQARQS